MSLDFVTIDFETANSFRASACAVGLARVRHGVVVDTASSLIRPPIGYDHFSFWNMRVHGITSAQVQDAPAFAEIWSSVLDFIGGRTVVAHNAPFDLSVVRAACTTSALPWPSLRYACSLALARRIYRLDSYALPVVVKAAGLEAFDHHDAEADALAAAGIMLDMAARSGVATLDELLATHKLPFGVLDPAMGPGCLMPVATALKHSARH